MAKHPRPRPTAQSTIKKSGASQSWTCAASGSRKRPHKTCYKCKSCDIQSRPCSISPHEHEHCTLLRYLSVFLNSGVEKIVLAYLHPKAITGFKIGWWWWNIWEAYNVFHTCKTSWVWKVLALLLSLLAQLRREKPDVETAPRHHACPQETSQETSLHQEHHYLCTGGRKKICPVAEQKSNFHLASRGLSTTGNGTQQNFPQALFSMAHPKPAGKRQNQKFPLASSSSLHESRGHLGEIVKYRREGDTSNPGSYYLNCFCMYIFL